jgi:D-alanyl-D-alanine carboxypeptidase (penicillin-binding protein 5/6)
MTYSNRALLAVIAAIAITAGYQLSAPPSSRPASSVDVVRSVPSTVWPAYGQAAVQLGRSQIQAGPNQHAAAIASVAKVMTAYVLLRDHPLRLGQDGPTITLTDADVAETDRRAGQDESVVPVAAGEQLTEQQNSKRCRRCFSRRRTTSLRCWRDGTPARRSGSSAG